MSDQRVWKEQICCIGAGYVGGPTMAVIAKHCPDIRVAVVDIDERRINAWNSDALPVFEPHLAETLAAARANNNLIFTCNIDEEIDRADIIFVAVATPTKNYGRGAGKAFDMTYWDAVARNIARVATRDKIIVEKSTVPVRTAENVIKILNANRRSKDIKFHVCCLLACLFVCLFVEPAGSMPHC
jgi:UDPglucose 6-dehydrogenase